MSKHLTIGLVGKSVRLVTEAQPVAFKPNGRPGELTSWRIVAYEPKDGLVTLRSAVAGQRDIVPWVWLRHQIAQGYLRVV